MSGMNAEEMRLFNNLAASLVRSMILHKIVNREETIAATANQMMGMLQARYSVECTSGDELLTSPVESELDARKRIETLKIHVSKAIEKSVNPKILTNTPSTATLAQIVDLASVQMDEIPEERQAIYTDLLVALARQKILSIAVDVGSGVDGEKQSLVKFLQQRFTIDDQHFTPAIESSLEAAMRRIDTAERKIDAAVRANISRALSFADENAPSV
jgi:hypothetical protein